ncbi:MAG: hypothetical protein LBJ64_07225 [Deltaproteobacteria bacterium]|jgi:hypothetical protein|nr:hypothetical protein [Deltaproteobacteria bacterium]
MFRIILIAVLFYLIIWVVRGLVAPRRARDTRQDEVELVRDAHSGEYFPKYKALAISRQGETFYFISQENRDAWLRNSGQR